MNFGTPGLEAVPIVWYFVDDTNPGLDLPTPFCSRNWQDNRKHEGGPLGEVIGADRVWSNGAPPFATPTAGAPCGTPEQWLGAAAIPTVPLSFGFPACCVPVPPAFTSVSADLVLSAAIAAPVLVRIDADLVAAGQQLEGVVLDADLVAAGQLSDVEVLAGDLVAAGQLSDVEVLVGDLVAAGNALPAELLDVNVAAAAEKIEPVFIDAAAVDVGGLYASEGSIEAAIGIAADLVNMEVLDVAIVFVGDIASAKSFL